MAKSHRGAPPRVSEPAPWWSSWPGALGLGVASLALVGVPAVLLTVYATLPAVALQGTDRPIADAGPPLALRILALVAAAMILCLPGFTVRWSRKRWAGWMLLGMIASGVTFIGSLFALGIL